MASAAAFKRCLSCNAKVPQTDNHDLCLICLGESHPTHSCPACKKFSKIAQKNRKNRLQAHLMATALAPQTQTMEDAEPSLPLPGPSSRASSIAASSTKTKKLSTAELFAKKKKKMDKAKKKKSSSSPLTPHQPRTSPPSSPTSEAFTQAILAHPPPPPLSPVRSSSITGEPVESAPTPPTRTTSLRSQRVRRTSVPPPPPPHRVPAAAPSVPVDALAPLLQAVAREFSAQMRAFLPHSEPTRVEPSTRSKRRKPMEPAAPSKRRRLDPVFAPLPPPPASCDSGDHPNTAGSYWSDSDPEASPAPPRLDVRSAGSGSHYAASETEDSDFDEPPVETDKALDDQVGSRDRFPPEEQRTFTGLLTRLGTTLNLKAETPPAPFTDEVCGLADAQKIPPVHLPLLPALGHAAQSVWRKPVSAHVVSSRLDGVYKLLGDDGSYLHTHPTPNSRVVRASQHRTALNNTPVPATKEGKKLDALGRRVYSHASFSFRAANYTTAMGAYQVKLWGRLESVLERIPADLRSELDALCREGTQLGRQQIKSSRHICDSEAKNVAAAVQIRRHSWLRSADLQEDTKKLIEEMPFDGKGLFAEETDTTLNDLHRDITTSNKLRLGSSSSSFRKPGQSYGFRSDFQSRQQFQPHRPTEQPGRHFYKPRRQYGQPRYPPQKRPDRKQKQA